MAGGMQAVGCRLQLSCCHAPARPAFCSPSPLPPQALPLLPSPWFVLGAELLQGATFALAWAAGTVHVKRISPPHLRSTVQSIFQVRVVGGWWAWVSDIGRGSWLVVR